MAVIDVVTFNGEYELFELRYNILKPYVDQFIVCEAPTTFSGEPKPLYFRDVEHKYAKTSYFVIDENWSEEEKMLAWESPNTVGAAHWTREFLQKESIKKALVGLVSSDLVFIGDVDEIWDKKVLYIKSWPLKLKLDVYTYYLNNHSNEQFWGTLVAPYEVIKNSCLNHLRTRAPKSKRNLGWHFTSMAKDLERKLTDSYTQESYATPTVLQNLAYNIEHNRDFLGRNFSYSTDESSWPDYLKRNKEHYAQLCKPNAGDVNSSSQADSPDSITEPTANLA